MFEARKDRWLLAGISLGVGPKTHCAIHHVDSNFFFFFFFSLKNPFHCLLLFTLVLQNCKFRLQRAGGTRQNLTQCLYFLFLPCLIPEIQQRKKSSYLCSENKFAERNKTDAEKQLFSGLLSSTNVLYP